MLPPLPRCSGWASSSLVSPNRVSLPRFHVRIGLHIVLFEACSAFTRVAACTLARSPYVVTAIRRLQTLRLLHACSGRFRLERSPGGACTHWKSAALSRRTRIADPQPSRASSPSKMCLLIPLITAAVPSRAIPSAAPQQRRKIVQNRLALVG